MEEDSFTRAFLSPKRGICLSKKDGWNEKKSRKVAPNVSHPITLSKLAIAQDSAR
jgi:hypothetical protein